MRPRFVAPRTFAAWLALACAPVALLGAQAPNPPIHSDSAAIADARADSVKRPWVRADVDFIAGMIHHHAQAILMAGWAPSHGASDAVRTLCARIINAQQDEIHLMQQWLADRRQLVPVPVYRDNRLSFSMWSPPGAAAAPVSMGMDMPGMGGGNGNHEMLMPGMLSPAQLDTLDAARGSDFDRYFLTYMIQHHKGAVSMVKTLFASYGAGEDEFIFKLATDINVDQTTEIARMQKMLVAVTLGIAP